MTKAEWVDKATKAGIENAESFTVAELQAKISEAESNNGSKDNSGQYEDDLDKEDQDQSGKDEDQASSSDQDAKPGYKYPKYDMWKIDSSVIRDSKGEPTGRYTFTAIKKLREKVKIETSVAEELNKQSHNSLRRYYLCDTVTNGNEETVSIKK